MSHITLVEVTKSGAVAVFNHKPFSLQNFKANALLQRFVSRSSLGLLLIRLVIHPVIWLNFFKTLKVSFPLSTVLGFWLVLCGKITHADESFLVDVGLSLLERVDPCLNKQWVG